MEDKQAFMASFAALRVAKKELRNLMKRRLPVISKESIDTQSNLVLSSANSPN